MKKLMERNKETASRLWVQQFGKQQKAIDFSGREIAKAAYNDRNSAYGWNVDHILPQSKGGKTVDYNLICCHILTNDEKADKFPCFKANGKAFEIQKRQNHYEIIAKSAERNEKGDGIVNFFDAAQGLKCWKRCRTHGGSAFVGYVKVRIEAAEVAGSKGNAFAGYGGLVTLSEIVGASAPFFDGYGRFLSELFGTENIFAENLSGDYHGSLFTHSGKRACNFTVIVGNIPTKEDTQNFLDNCIILNTYNRYFIRKNYLENIQVVCGMKCYDSRFEMFSRYKEDIVNQRVQFNDSLMIDELVKVNTEADKKLRGTFPQSGFYPYNYIFTKLEENLDKHI